jgi:hypothetical protein
MKREDRHIEDLKRLMQSAFPPMESQLRRDLWPEMLKRMTAGPIAVPWYDWALIALLTGWVLAVPQSILQLLYQF